MKTLFITVNGRRLAVAEDEAALKAKIVAALRSGGDFVAIATRQGALEVLVTSGVSLLVETMSDQEPNLAAAGAAGIGTLVQPVDDFDDWGI